MQLLLQALALIAVVFVVWWHRWSGVLVSAVLGALWAWTGVAYHLAFFSAINPLAWVFGAASLLGAGLFMWEGVLRRRLQFRLAAGRRAAGGIGLVLFALLAYPLWSTLAGHGYPRLPTFGLPCPTTLFTIGLLSLLVAPYPRSPIVVPVAWSLVGAQAAVLFGVWADLALLAAAVQGALLLWKASPPVRAPGR